MIKVTFIGRIGKDAVVLEGKNGKNFLSMDVATDMRSGGENKPVWIRVNSSQQQHMGKLVDYLTKGKPIEITGVLAKPSAWISKKSGEPMAQDVVWADKIEFIPFGKKKDDNETDVRAAQAENIPDPTNSNTPFPEPAPDGADDLPF